MPFKANDPLILAYWNGTVWQVASPITYMIDDTMEVTVPKGFPTDLGSIPQVFWNILPPQGGSFANYGPAVVVHDYIYKYGTIYNSKLNKEQVIDKITADNILYQALTDLNNPWWVKTLLYYGVKFGGATSWNRWRRLDVKKE